MIFILFVYEYKYSSSQTHLLKYQVWAFKPITCGMFVPTTKDDPVTTHGLRLGNSDPVVPQDCSDNSGWVRGGTRKTLSAPETH